MLILNLTFKPILKIFNNPQAEKNQSMHAPSTTGMENEKHTALSVM